MDRFVFYNSQCLDPKSLTVAKKTAREKGATVLRAAVGTMLVEAAPADAAEVARALPGWRYSAETRTHRVPERTTLQRAKLAASKG